MENNEESIKKIDLDKNSNKENVIKTIKNIINTNTNNNNSRGNLLDTAEVDEKNKEDDNNKDNCNISDNIINDVINTKEINTIENNNEIIIVNNNKDKIEENINEDNIKKKNSDIIEEEKNGEDPLISYMNLNLKITEEEEKNSPKLFLEEVNSNIFDGKKIEITAAGMVGGRDKKDGFSIFGLKKREDTKRSYEDSEDFIKQENESNFTPDFELNYSQILPYPYIFTIYFVREKKSFYIKGFSGKGSDNKVLFIKLSSKNKFIINQKELILTGNIIFQITPLRDDSIEIINLSKKKENEINTKYIINGFDKKTIRIGRHIDCEFSFPKNKNFSRFQTTIEFDEEQKKWAIMDGYQNKSSTNGTWIFGTHSFLIKDEMIVEILNCQVKILEIRNNSI